MPKAKKPQWEMTYKPGELNELRDARVAKYQADQEAQGVKASHVAPQNLDPVKTKEVEESLRRRRR